MNDTRTRLSLVVAKVKVVLPLVVMLLGLRMAQAHTPQPADYRVAEIAKLLKGKKVALVMHAASMVEQTSVLDTLLALKVNVVKLLAPEHGIRGNVEAGGKVDNAVDSRTKIPIISMYGASKELSSKQLKDVDVVVFDLQDVGVRCFTYISTLHYVMEACATHKKKLMVLDRPNPNGQYIDGPMLDVKFKSFVGMHPVPLVHGLTIGEYACMINGEGWLSKKQQCELVVVKAVGYSHNMRYHSPYPPSPNLASDAAVILYPTLVLFEGTPVSIGRGTDKAFEVIGHPRLTSGSYKFVPQRIAGKAENPPHKGDTCYGYDFDTFAMSYLWNQPEIRIGVVKSCYDLLHEGEKGGKFFNDFFDKLAGTDQLRKQIEAGVNETQIKASWKTGLDSFMTTRRKYLIYDDFDGYSAKEVKLPKKCEVY